MRSESGYLWQEKESLTGTKMSGTAEVREGQLLRDLP